MRDSLKTSRDAGRFPILPDTPPPRHTRNPLRLMNILRLPGPNALSDFRREALLQRCRQVEPAVQGLEARHFYLVHWDGGDRGRLDALVFGNPAGLDRPPTQGLDEGGDTSICIAPRPGTISPWSTKATDILHNCGLTSVARIERGTEYRILADGPFSPASLLPLLHDRMTEAILEEDAALFSEVAPRPLAAGISRRRGRGP